MKKKEILTGTVESIALIVEIVGGQFGQVSLEKKFDIVESDENADSYLARSEEVWTELPMKKISLAEVQVYIILRGSRLSMEDKKGYCTC